MLLQLPADIQRLIFKQPCLGSRELSSLEATSRAVRSLVDEDVWRQALLRTALRVRGWALCDRALLGVRVCALRAATRGIERSVGPVDGRRARGGRRKTGVARARVTGGAPFLPYLAAPAQLAAALTARAPSAAASEAGENEEEDVGHFSLGAASLQCLRVRGHEVRYVGTALGGDRAVRGGLPLPQHRHMSLRAVSPLRLVADEALVAYFEVTIWPRGGGAAEAEWLPQSDCVAVGLGSRDFPLDGRQPGWDSASFGYHSDDGQAFHGHGASGRPLGPACSPGDVVGAGYSLLSRRVFFSRNGVFLGAPYVAPAQLMPLYPLVGLDSRAPIEFNFGASPFALDTASLPPSLHRPSTSKLARVTSLEAAVRSALACVVPAWGPAG